MALKNKVEKHSEALNECRKVWARLRNLPEYKQDFARLAKTKEYKAHKSGKKSLTFENLWGLREKWGFFPLMDPKEEHNGYLFEALSIMGEDFLRGPLNIESGADWLPFLERTKDGIIDMRGKKHKMEDMPKLLARMTVAFDPRLPIGTLTAEFEKKVRHIQNLYSIKSKRVRYDTFLTAYFAFIGRNLGWSKARVRRAIHGPDKGPPSYSPLTESHRQAVKRASKKLPR